MRVCWAKSVTAYFGSGHETWRDAPRHEEACRIVRVPDTHVPKRVQDIMTDKHFVCKTARCEHDALRGSDRRFDAAVLVLDASHPPVLDENPVARVLVQTGIPWSSADLNRRPARALPKTSRGERPWRSRPSDVARPPGGRPGPSHLGERNARMSVVDVGDIPPAFRPGSSWSAVAAAAARAQSPSARPSNGTGITVRGMDTVAPGMSIR